MDPEGIVRSEGAARLGRIPETQGQIARKLGVRQPTVSDWVCCKKRPDYANRMLLQQHYEIPHEAWDRPPEANTTGSEIKNAPAL